MPVRSSLPYSPSSQRPLLSVSYVPLDRLKPDPGNARQHSAKQIRQIAKSIETFGFNVPILVDAHGNVVAGHGEAFDAVAVARGTINPSMEAIS